MYALKVGMMRNIFSPVRSTVMQSSCRPFSLLDLSFIAQQQYYSHNSIYCMYWFYQSSDTVFPHIQLGPSMMW